MIEFFKSVDAINALDITKEELERQLSIMRSTRPESTKMLGTSGVYLEHVFNAIIPDDKGMYVSDINSLFYFDGKVYRLDRISLSLDDITSAPIPKIDLDKDKFEMPTEKPKSTFSADFRKVLEIFHYLEKNPHALPNKSILPPDEQNHQLTAGKPSYLPFQLSDKESMKLTFIEGGTETRVVNTIKATKIINGEEKPMELGETYLSNPGDTIDFKIFNNVISMKPLTNGTVTVDRNPSDIIAQRQESNQNKDFIPSNVTIDYGGDVWTDPRRILLDAIQNHVDANKDQLPNIVYTVVDNDGEILRVTKDELQKMNNGWNIVGVNISDTGDGYSTPYLTRLGGSTKSKGDLGKFGEGLKMLAASAVVQGISVELGSRDWVARPTTYQSTAKDYESGKESAFTMLGYNMEWNDERRVGSYTNFLYLL